MGVSAEADLTGKRYTVFPADICVLYALNGLAIIPVQSEYVYYQNETEDMAMTRFEREISGSLGAFWKKNAEEEVKKAVAQAEKDAAVEADGAIKWNSNGRYLMDDFCEKLEYAGFPFSRKATADKREAQVEEELAEYRRNHRELAAGELAEARAAFEEGTTVVNVLTGERTKL